MSHQGLETCWFCEKMGAHKGSAIPVRLERIIKERSFGASGLQRQWEYIHVEVPRCMSCRDKHDKASKHARKSLLIAGIAWLVLFIGMMVIISLLSTSSAGRNDALVVIATILIILALLINSLGFALWIRKSMKRLLNGTKPLKYKHKYPAIVALVDGGYVISMAQRKPALVPGAGLQPWATAASGREPRTHVIPKSYGLYDDSPLIVEESPDLERLLNSDEPPVIQTLSDRNRSFWEEVASTEAKRTSLLIGYLQHPDPDIRIRTMEYAAMSASSRVTQVLVDILGSDPSSTVKIAAAKTIWEREKESNCDFTIRCLKDEIDYGTERSTVGPTRAKGAMRLLIEHAPDQDRREAVKELIRSKGIHDI